MEDLKEEKYVKGRSWSRLASRHFRNHALHLQRAGQWEVFKSFCRPWLPEIELLDVKLDTSSARLGIFYAEPGSRVPKQLAWAGDGMQIWVQLLWHLYRAQGSETIVLDEPEVYLHPDLQRRLVRLLDGLSAQIILASHSSDVIAEAPPNGVLWVDRRLGKAHRPKSQKSMAALSASLGSSYNLALARSLRSRLVIATDCQDVRVIRQLARQVGGVNLANEHTVSIVQLRTEMTTGLPLTPRTDAPRGPSSQASSRAVATSWVVLNEQLERYLAAPDVDVKFLPLPEVENYLIDPETIARVSGAAPEAVRIRVAEACLTLRETTRSMMSAIWVRSALTGNTHRALKDAESTFDIWWADPRSRILVVRGTDIITELNGWLEADGYRPINGHLLAKAIRPQSLSVDILTVLLSIDEMVT